MLYVKSIIPCAVKLNGNFIGICKGLSKCPSNGNSLIELLPLDSSLLPVHLTTDLSFTPKFTKTYKIYDDLFVFQDGFPKIPYEYALTYSKRHNVAGIPVNVSVVADGNVKLIVENEYSAEMTELPLLPTSVDVEYAYSPFGTYCVISLKGKTQTVAVYKIDDKIKNVFFSTVTRYDVNDYFTFEKDFDGVITHTVTERRTLNERFDIVNRTVTSLTPVTTLSKRNLIVAFFERINLDGDVSEFLTGNVLNNKQMLKGYIGGFSRVILSPYEDDEVITFSNDKYDFFKIETHNGLIGNLTKKD